MIAIIQDPSTRQWDVCIERGGLQYVMATAPDPIEATRVVPMVLAAYLPADQRRELRGLVVDVTV